MKRTILKFIGRLFDTSRRAEIHDLTHALVTMRGADVRHRREIAALRECLNRIAAEAAMMLVEDEALDGPMPPNQRDSLQAILAECSSAVGNDLSKAYAGMSGARLRDVHRMKREECKQEAKVIGAGSFGSEQ